MTSSGSGGSNRARLLLEITHVDSHCEEVYVADKLTIGSDPANEITIQDTANSVSAFHAKVFANGQGDLVLRAKAAEAPMLVDGKPVLAIVLQHGAEWQLGGAKFLCLEVADKSPNSPAIVHYPPRCPHCNTADLPPPADVPVECLQCGKRILVISVDRDAAETLILPAEFDDFEIDRIAAHGGMGCVLKGLDRCSRCAVAIKILRPGVLHAGSAAARFEKEIDLLAKLPLSCVPRFLKHGQTAGLRFFAMEWVEGKSLKDVLNDAKRNGSLLEPGIVLRWFKQVCRSLEAMHVLGIVHRDIKPANLILIADNVVRIVDMGVAKTLRWQESNLTVLGMAIGTLDYMAPEQRQGSATIDHRADLYSLGVTFYELFAGRLPKGERITKYNPAVPFQVTSILARLLQESPEDRYPDALEVWHELSEIPTDKLLPPFYPNWSLLWLLGVFGVVVPLSLNLLLLLLFPTKPFALWSGFACGAVFLLLNLKRLVPDGLVADVAIAYRSCDIPLREKTFAVVRRWGSSLSVVAGFVLIGLVAMNTTLRWYSPFVLGIVLLAWLFVPANLKSVIGGLRTAAKVCDSVLIASNVKSFLKEHWRFCSVPFSALLVSFACAAFSPIHFIERGENGLHVCSYDQAIVDFTRAIRFGPRNAAAFLKRAEARRLMADLDFADVAAGQFDHGLVEEAIEDYDEAIRLDPDNVIALVGRAACYCANHDYDLCLKDTRLAISIDPRVSGAWRYSAEAKYRKQKYSAHKLSEALGDALLLRSLEPKMARAYKIIGDVLSYWGLQDPRNQEMIDEAVDNYTKAIKIDDRLWQAYYKRGSVYEKTGQIDLAKADKDEVAEIRGLWQPADTVAFGSLGGGELFRDPPSLDTSRRPDLLTGVEYTLGDYDGRTVIASIQPVYRVNAVLARGDVHGSPRGEERHICAKDGYAVGGIIVRSGHRIDGFKLIFMRQKGFALDPNDLYESVWIGGDGGTEGTPWKSNGRLVVGIHGRSGEQLDVIGFIQADLSIGR